MRAGRKARIAAALTGTLILAILAPTARGDGVLLAAGDTAKVRLDVSRERPRVGSIVSVKIEIRGARDVGSVPFALRYDPAVLEFLPGRTREGRFLSRDGGATSFLAVAGALPSGGTGVVVGLSRLQGGNGMTGSGSLCTLFFKARAPGTATLSFARGHVLTPQMEDLPVRFKGGSLTVRRSR